MHLRRTTYNIRNEFDGTRRTRSRPRRRLDYRQGGVRMRHEHILGLCRRLPAAGSRHRRERPFEVISGFRLRISLRGRPCRRKWKGTGCVRTWTWRWTWSGVQTVTVETSHGCSGSVSDLSSPLVCRCQTEDVQSQHPTARDATRPPAGLVATYTVVHTPAQCSGTSTSQRPCGPAAQWPCLPARWLSVLSCLPIWY